MYVSSVCYDFSGDDAVSLMALSARDAAKRQSLDKLIEEKQKVITRRISSDYYGISEADLFDNKKFSDDYKKLIDPLLERRNKIKGPSQIYRIEEGKYKKGQILNEIPPEAVRIYRSNI